MSPLVNATETDDPKFISIVNCLVSGLVSRQGAPNELWIIHIDNWFDHKWLRFSGIGRVDFQFPAFMNRIDAAPAVFYGGIRKLALPPFTPNRVLGQRSFVRAGDHFTEAPQDALPHPTAKHPSEMNLHRTLQNFSSSASFVWYSGNTLANGKGSVMVYSIAENLFEAWFAAFTRQQTWQLHATKGVSRDGVEALLQVKLPNER